MMTIKLTHLQQLEAESIHIMREVAAEFDNPVMLYSVGKDSAVMLHLAMKAFAPGKPPFPMMHVDTTWKFKEMIAFRDQRVKELGLDLIVEKNEQQSKLVQRRCLRVKTNLKKGHTLLESNLISLRPISEGGFEPFEQHMLIGKELLQDIEAGEHLTKKIVKI